MGKDNNGVEVETRGGKAVLAPITIKVGEVRITKPSPMGAVVVRGTIKIDPNTGLVQSYTKES
jgi:hypothetical protein